LEDWEEEGLGGGRRDGELGREELGAAKDVPREE